MDEFVLTVPRYTQSDRPKIHISQEAYAVLTEMCARTAIPMSKVASAAILYAAQHLAIQTVGEEDKDNAGHS